MDWWGAARALHVVGVVLWIGGVGLVTLVLLPALATEPAAARLGMFDRIERRFATIARWVVATVGVSGIYLAHTMDLDSRFASAHYWWMHAMVLVWIVFALVLYVLEPLVLHRWLHARSARDPEGTFRLVFRAHWVLLAASIVTIAGAAAGAHGLKLSPM